LLCNSAVIAARKTVINRFSLAAFNYAGVLLFGIHNILSHFFGFCKRVFRFLYVKNKQNISLYFGHIVGLS